LVALGDVCQQIAGEVGGRLCGVSLETRASIEVNGS
jgi:hypothetical protein